VVKQPSISLASLSDTFRQLGYILVRISLKIIAAGLEVLADYYVCSIPRPATGIGNQGYSLNSLGLFLDLN